MWVNQSSTGRRPASSQSEAIPAFLVWKAFVLQFSRETGTKAGIFSGRVAHLRSGRRARFASREELLPVLSKMLDDLGEKGT
jgi:hypothetical protein